MIAHLATFTFRDDVTAAEVDHLADDLRAVAGELVARSIAPRLATRQASRLELAPEWPGWSDG